MLYKARFDDNCQEVLDLLLEAGANVNMFDDLQGNLSLLMLAILNISNDKIVRTILNHGPSLDFRDADGNTILTRMNRHTSDHTVKMLVRCGAKLDVANDYRQTPLIAAIGAGNLFVFNFLLTLDIVKSSLNFPFGFGRRTSLHLAVEMNNADMVNSLVEYGADIDFTDDIVGTPIMTAIHLRRDAIAETLLNRGAQLTRPAGLFSFPINIASLAASPAFVRLLLEKAESGVSIDVLDEFDRKPVHLACYNSLGVLNELGVPDGDFAARDRVGRVPLHYAALTGNVELLEAVLERSKRVGVDLNVKDNDGWTPLLWAARFCNTLRSSPSPRMQHEMIEHLLGNGADVGVRARGIDADDDDYSWTAADVAQYHQASPFVVGLLRDRAAAKGRRFTGMQKCGEETNCYCNCCLAVSACLLPSAAGLNT